jgi:hypothetical protein
LDTRPAAGARCRAALPPNQVFLFISSQIDITFRSGDFFPPSPVLNEAQPDGSGKILVRSELQYGQIHLPRAAEYESPLQKGQIFLYNRISSPPILIFPI